MRAAVLMAFLHHLGAFTVVATLAVETALFRLPLNLAQARRLQAADLIFGIAAGAVLAAGLLRVRYFEKGAHYYWHDAYFIVKFSAFVLAGLISIYPTVTFLSWGSALKAGNVPTVVPEHYRRVRPCLVLELTAIVVILLCAPLMARGFGAFG